MDKKDWKTQAHTDKFLKELWYKGEKSNMAVAIGWIMVRKWLFFKLCEYSGGDDTSEGIIEMKMTKWGRGTREGWEREKEGERGREVWKREAERDTKGEREREYIPKCEKELIYCTSGRGEFMTHISQIVLSSLLDKFCLSKT